MIRPILFLEMLRSFWPREETDCHPARRWPSRTEEPQIFVRWMVMPFVDKAWWGFLSRHTLQALVFGVN